MTPHHHPLLHSCDYLVSGVPPGQGGAGRLINSLSRIYPTSQVIFKRLPAKLTRAFTIEASLANSCELFRRLRTNLRLFYFSLVTRRHRLLFLCPQYAGFLLLYLLALSNTVFLYVLDNSFFCIQSYNHHPINNRECLGCLYAFNPHIQCLSFPIRTLRIFSRLNRYLFSFFSSRIHFLAQNSNQAFLIRQRFPMARSVSIVGMETDELDPVYVTPYTVEFESYKGSIVYHGSLHDAKGIHYFLALSSFLRSYKFFVPYDRKELYGLSPCHFENVIFRSMTWESGLSLVVQNSLITVNPSLWSAPIEGALLKSLAVAPLTATVTSLWGYESESHVSSQLIRLSPTPLLASHQIHQILTGDH